MTTPEPAVEAAAPEGRANVSTATFMQSILTAICPTGGTQRIKLHTASPGINGANVAGGGWNAGKVLTWGAASGGGAGIASSTATAVNFTTVPAGTYTHYGVYAADDTTFLYGKPLTPSVTIPAAATGTITVTASHTYDLT